MQITEDRRALHRIPEPDNRLPQTMAYLRHALEGLHCTLSSPIPGSLCAFFDTGAARTIAFRSDADALPIQEKTGLPFASGHEGYMHACGHDGHMAILLELARQLDTVPPQGVNVLLVFQPSEETTGGARQVCDSGVFEKYKVESIFGLHLWPELPSGTVGSRPGEFMARSGEVTVDITGRSSHIARASEGVDALRAGVELYSRMIALEQALPPETHRLLGFGRMDSGTVRNAVSGHTRIEGTLRAFSDKMFEGLADSIRQAGDTVARETGCTVDIRISEGYPAVYNPPELYDRIVSGCIPQITTLEKPSMITEDFSWYQRYLPGLFFFLGVGPAPALHADTFNFDESALLNGVALFRGIADGYAEVCP